MSFVIWCFKFVCWNFLMSCNSYDKSCRFQITTISYRWWVLELFGDMPPQPFIFPHDWTDSSLKRCDVKANKQTWTWLGARDVMQRICTATNTRTISSISSSKSFNRSNIGLLRVLTWCLHVIYFKQAVNWLIYLYISTHILHKNYFFFIRLTHQ